MMWISNRLFSSMTMSLWSLCRLHCFREIDGHFVLEYSMVFLTLNLFDLFGPLSVSSFFTLCQVASHVARDKNCPGAEFTRQTHTHTYTRDVLWFFIVPKGLGWWKKNKSNMIWWYTIKLNAGQPKKQGGRAELCDQLYRKVFMAPMWPTHQTTQQFGWQCWCQFTFNFTAAILFRPSFIPLLSPLSCALELLL